MSSSIEELLEEVETLQREGRYQELIHIFTKALEIRPDSASMYVNRGNSWTDIKKYDKAIDDFNKAIAINPDKASAWYGLGDVWYCKKDYDNAIENYDKAITLQPDADELYYKRGVAWEEKGEYEKALEDYDRSIALRPDIASSYTNRGNVLRKMGNYGKAMQNLYRSIEIRADNRRAYFGLGRLYETLNEWELASVHYKRAYYLKYEGGYLIHVFQNKIPAPYIVKHIVSGGPENKNAEANFSTLEWLIATCKSWDTCMMYLREKEFPVTNPDLYHSLEAIVHYYMGNSIAAYRIFDTQFDSDEYPFPLTMRDQYYLALSAADFKEPDNGLSYAIGQARKEDGSDPLSTYYAGQLYLLVEDPEAALRCFDACGDFLPACYGKVAAYKLLDDHAGSLRTAEEIAAAEAAPGAEISLLDGITPLTVHAAMSAVEIFSGIMRRIPYYELSDEIAAARTLLNREPRHPHLPFSALLTLA
jgi:Flp pilus assembly protein TadD